jgi:hypothetical protein
MDLMQLYRDVLSGAGHEVDGFTDSLDAYSRFQANPDLYDAGFGCHTTSKPTARK